MNDIPSTIKEPRFRASCKHCDNTFFGFTMEDLYKHLKEHEIGIHFSDVSVISTVITTNKDFIDDFEEDDNE